MDLGLNAFSSSLYSVPALCSKDLKAAPIIDVSLLIITKNLVPTRKQLYVNVYYVAGWVLCLVCALCFFARN
jgi:hypothetical protein